MATSPNKPAATPHSLHEGTTFRTKAPTPKQLRDLDARIDRVRREAIQTLAKIQAIGRR